MKVRNLFEKKIHTRLRRAKAEFKYEAEKIPYVLALHYCPDFIVTTPSGKVYIECKGYFRKEDKAKMRAVKKQHPELDIRLLFYSFRKEYERWATRNGFKYAFETIPKDWLL